MYNSWTETDIERLRTLYRTDTPGTEIARILGRPLSSVYVKANRLGLPRKPDPHRCRLDAEQLSWLKRAFPECRNEICALRLGISVSSVIRIAHRMGLRKTPAFMTDCQRYTAKKAKESHLRNGTYPKKGIVNPNIAKGAAYRFKPGHPSATTSKTKTSKTNGEEEIHNPGEA